MRTLIAIGLALMIGTASAQTGLPAPCNADFDVHAYDEADGPTQLLVDERNITHVSRRAEDASRLMIALDESGAERMRAFTRENIGEQMVVLCEGERVWRAEIAAEFGERFEIRLD
jgi:preprotein translocase subunit SecD